MRQFLIDALGPDGFDDLLAIVAVGLPLMTILVMVRNWGSGGVLIPLLWPPANSGDAGDMADHDSMTGCDVGEVGGEGCGDC